MRLHTSTPTLFAVSSLFCLSSSLPFFRQGTPWMEPLVRRATYSVVAVDGGPAATTTYPQAVSTITDTITQTPAPATKTIIETENITLESVTTDYLISTQTINGPETTQTLVVTITPSESLITVTATRYSIVDVSPPPVTVESPAPASTTLSASSTSPSSSSYPEKSPASISITSSTTSTLSLPLSGTLSSSATTSQEVSTSSSSASATISGSVASEPASYISSFTSSLGTSTITSISATSTSTKSYDDGQWHTSYPPWSNSTATATYPVMPTQIPSVIIPDEENSLDTAVSTILGRTAEIGTKIFKKMGF